MFNALWDLIARNNKKPLWQFIVDSEPETIINWLTFKHIEDVLINGEKDNKLVEYQDSLHEHFVYPCIIKNGNYFPPLDQGYSIEMKKKSVNTFSFPNGEYWIKNT